jgi:4-amino-4-deoxy-L-arabinose transferase-like glycosyltransferase
LETGYLDSRKDFFLKITKYFDTNTILDKELTKSGYFGSIKTTMKAKLEAVNNSIYTNFKDYFVFFVILAVFLLLRIPALNTPYHQDEYKWPLYAEGIVYKAGSVPHPPLTEFVYQISGKIFSLNDFRVTPLVFSILNLALLYIFVHRRFGFKTAIISSLFFTFSFYSVLASVMVDTDGAVLPFFFLLALIAYDFFKQSSGKKKWVYALLTCGALFLGILVKLSSVLAIGAIIIDYFFETQEKLSPKQIAKYFAGMLVFGVVIVGFLFLAQNIFPGFSLAKGLHYWETFMRGFASRNFLQTAIQFFKALLYVSPFLVFVSFLRNPFRGDTRVFSIFIFLGLFFYLILFDFSIGALDRYFEFLILPLCIMSASNIFYFF